MTNYQLRLVQILIIAGNVGDTMAVSNGFGQHESLVPPAEIKQFQKWYVRYRSFAIIMASCCIAYRLTTGQDEYRLDHGIYMLLLRPHVRLTLRPPPFACLQALAEERHPHRFCPQHSSNSHWDRQLRP